MKHQNDHFLINGISEIADRYNAFIIDIWGVLHDGIRPFEGTVDCLKKMKECEKSVCLLSNTPNEGPDVSHALSSMGISRDLYNHIVTAGDSAVEDLKTRSGQKAFYAGNHYGAPLTTGHKMRSVDKAEDADLIINDLYDLADGEAERILSKLKTAAKKNIPMICGNPDLVVNIGRSLKKCPGFYAQKYEEMGGRVIYHGKPHIPVYERAWKKLGHPEKDKILAIGDSFHTDIHGAHNFGIDSAFHLVGIHFEEIAMDHAPDEADLDKVIAMTQKQTYQPTYALAAFQW